MSHVVGHVDTYENAAEFDARTRREWYTPQQEFAQVVGAQTPQFAYQAPYTTRQNELLTRYRLADPYMWGPSTGAASTPTFRDYIGGGASPSGAPMWGQGVGIDELTRRAKAASDIGALSAPDLATRWREAELEDDPVAARNRLAWYYSEFGPENRAQSQLNLASMLAMQRPGGGQYGGRLGQAIQNLLSRVQLGRETVGGAPEQFLDWYLGSPAGS